MEVQVILSTVILSQMTQLEYLTVYGVNKASELGFNSSMSGYKFDSGSNLMITYLD